MDVLGVSCSSGLSTRYYLCYKSGAISDRSLGKIRANPLHDLSFVIEAPVNLLGLSSLQVRNTVEIFTEDSIDVRDLEIFT